MNFILNLFKQSIGFNWSPEELIESLTTFRCWLVVVFAVVCTSANAGEKLEIKINNQPIVMYRTADLADAKTEAAAAHKPIAWVAASPKWLDGKGSISQTNTRAATLHALLAVHGKTVIIFEDAFEENHKVLKLVDSALHTPNPHYIPPTVVFLDAEAKQVLATFIYEPNFMKRANGLAKTLDDLKGKF